MMSVPMNATDISLQLGILTRELQQVLVDLESADSTWVRKRHEYEQAYARAYMAAEGSIEARKHLAVIAVADIKLESEVSEAVVRHLRRRVDVLKVRVDVGRTWSSAHKAELGLLGRDGVL